ESPRGGAPLRLPERQVDLRAIQVGRQPLLLLRGARRLGGVHLHALREVQEPVEGAQRRKDSCHGTPGESPLFQGAEEAADRQAVDARPAPRAAVEVVAERREGAHVPPVRLHGVRRVVALFGEERRERGDLGPLAHAGTPTPSRPANTSISASARSTRRSFFFCLSLTGGSSGSSSPKFAFIG